MSEIIFGGRANTRWRDCVCCSPCIWSLSLFIFLYFTLPQFVIHYKCLKQFIKICNFINSLSVHILCHHSSNPPVWQKFIFYIYHNFLHSSLCLGVFWRSTFSHWQSSKIFSNVWFFSLLIFHSFLFCFHMCLLWSFSFALLLFSTWTPICFLESTWIFYSYEVVLRGLFIAKFDLHIWIKEIL